MTASQSKRYLSEFKAALFDVDQTLTNTNREVSTRTLQALTALQKAGIVAGLATGRTSIALKDRFLPLFPPQNLHISAGGAQLIKGDSTILWEERLDPAIVRDIYQQANAQDFPINLQQDGIMYVNEGMKAYLDIHGLRYLFNPSQSIKPISELKDWSIANIILFGSEEFIGHLKMIPQIQVKQYKNDMTHTDITAPGITKGTTAVRWSQQTGIPLDKVIVFGDSDNDLEIFQVAGWKVALGNAIEPLKAIADRIIAHTDQDGLAIYLEKIVKGEPL